MPPLREVKNKKRKVEETKSEGALFVKRGKEKARAYCKMIGLYHLSLLICNSFYRKPPGILKFEILI